MNQYKPYPKVAAGGLVGAIAALVAITFGLSGEVSNALVLIATIVLPVVAQFAAAWIKVDPNLEKLKRILEEMDEPTPEV